MEFEVNEGKQSKIIEASKSVLRLAMNKAPFEQLTNVSSMKGGGTTSQLFKLVAYRAWAIRTGLPKYLDDSHAKLVRWFTEQEEVGHCSFRMPSGKIRCHQYDPDVFDDFAWALMAMVNIAIQGSDDDILECCNIWWGCEVWGWEQGLAKESNNLRNYLYYKYNNPSIDFDTNQLTSLQQEVVTIFKHNKSLGWDFPNAIQPVLSRPLA